MLDDSCFRLSSTEIRSAEFEIRTKIPIGSKVGNRYDLEERAEAFARRVRDFIRELPKELTNVEYSRQLVRASGSIGANYIEANEALSKKDFLMRIKISRKESKESRFWLRLIAPSVGQAQEQEALIKEATELMLILGAILRNAQKG